MADSPTSLPNFTMSTSTMGREAGYMFWRQAHGVLFEPNDDPPEVIAGFETEVTIYNAGPMLIGGGLVAEQRFHRTPAIIARDGIDHYFLLISKSGGFEGLCDGIRISIPAGAACLFNFQSPADIWSSRGDCIAIALPRASLAPYLANPDSVSGTVLTSDAPLCGILCDHIGGMLATAPRLTLDDATGLVRSAAAMIGVCFGAAAAPKSDVAAKLREASLVAIRRHIDATLGAPELGAEQLTAMFGLSRASLYRLFEPMGGVADFIRRRRLRKALLDLSSAEFAHLQVAEIALRLGFASGASFARAFKASYKINPSDIRGDPKAAMRALAETDNSDEPMLAEWLQDLS